MDLPKERTVPFETSWQELQSEAFFQELHEVDLVKRREHCLSEPDVTLERLLELLGGLTDGI